jgi:catechol 2,3-dioxygenase-like lactoylglutathione lyase family enzyme
MEQAVRSYNVGGILLDRPFKIRRLGHFGMNLEFLEEGRRFYCDLLGFRLTDISDLSKSPRAPKVAAPKDWRLFFASHNTDHHSFVFGDKTLNALMFGDEFRPDNTINQLTWQVGTLKEVSDAIGFLSERGVKMQRLGRDMPGGNWHAYFTDPDDHTVELYYGMEQRGWDQMSRPRVMYDRRFNEAAPIPQISEEQEVDQALAAGVDIFSGHRAKDDALPSIFDVGAIMLPRPFKITRIGPVSLFVVDVGRSEDFYVNVLGFIKTEEFVYRGKRCVHLRNGNEHHSLTLVPKSLRGDLGLGAHTSMMTFGVQVGDYEQLCNAVRFLKERGVRFIDTIPAEFHAGIDYAAHALDPDGTCIQLYYYMEQIGWDGKPRPADQRRAVSSTWPDTLEPLSDTFADQTFQGPLG